MNKNEINKLHNGDQIFWKDPDNNNCSRYYTIRNIFIKGNIICITDIDGSYLECFAHELN